MGFEEGSNQGRSAEMGGGGGGSGVHNEIKERQSSHRSTQSRQRRTIGD